MGEGGEIIGLLLFAKFYSGDKQTKLMCTAIKIYHVHIYIHTYIHTYMYIYAYILHTYIILYTYRTARNFCGDFNLANW